MLASEWMSRLATDQQPFVVVKVKEELKTKASPPRQCSTRRILSRAYAAIRECS